MPKATVKFPFEWKIWEWAQAMTKSMTGAAHSFLFLLQEDGVARQVIFGMEPGRMDDRLKESATEEYDCWVLFEPFDGPVYTFMEWRNVSRATFERLLNREFLADEFESEGETTDFPTSHSVMF